MTRSTIVLAFWAVWLIATSALSQDKAPVREQTNFSAEDEGVRSPVRIPDDAWAILKVDKNTRVYLGEEDKKQAEPQRSWFSAASVHLQDSKRNDLVIVGKGPLRGANIVTFWVFLDTPSGMKLAGTAAAHDLIIQRSRYMGIRTIKLYSMTCCKITTTWLRLDQRKLRQYRQITEDIK